MTRTSRRMRISLYTGTAAVALFLTALSLLFGASSVLAAGPRSQVSARVTLPGHIVPALKHHAPLHATRGSQTLQLSISLNLRDSAGLDALIAAQNDPRSPLYHHYLTPQQFLARFAPTQQTVDTVSNYLRQQGLHINSVAPNRQIINVSGTVEQVNRALSVTISDYQLDSRTVYAPDREPSLPTNLVNAVVSIGGLNNAIQYHHNATILPKTSKIANTGPGGGYTPSELRTAYNVTPLISAGYSGSGQTVALFELDGYSSTNINTYLNYYSLGSAKYSNVLVDGATNSPGDGQVEVELDMEVVSALAPNASQLVYIGPNSDSGVTDTYNRIVSDNRAKVTSISWGLCEASSGNSTLAALHNIFSQGAAQGQAFFAASGDSGAYDCSDNNLAVDSPADDPYVVGVGGTNLQVGSGGTYSSESVWSCSSCSGRGPNGTGGGGGVSTYFTRPSYQTGPGLTNPNRMVPDVSGDADPSSGYSIYSSGSWTVIGGTSAAAPLWAGIATDLNQYLAAQSKPVLGNAHESLYALYNTTQTYAAYHDITSGNNLYYQATSGYDLASGIGTPNVWNMAQDLAGSSGGGGDGGTTTQALSNPGFENGQTPWQESSANGYQLVDTTSAHGGSYSAFLCGYNSCNDQIWQSVAIPSNATTIQLSFWLNVSTQESGSTCYDYFYARLRTSSGSTISTVKSLCNSTASGWKQYTFDVSSTLSSYKGQTIQVYFQGKTDSYLTTSFFVDDAALNITTS